MYQALRQRLIEVLSAVTPLIGAATLLQLMLGGAPASLFLQFFTGAALAIAGMMLLFTGIELGILPMGRFIGAELPKKGSIWLILGVAFALGAATTIAEPDVLVLANQVQASSGGAQSARMLAYVIALGVGLFVALALLRILWGMPMTYLLTAVYGAMLVLSLLAPPALAPLAYDAGSVTTGVLSAPVILALALGLSSVLSGRSAISDGFGLLGLASAGPVIAILLLGLFS